MKRIFRKPAVLITIALVVFFAAYIASLQAQKVQKASQPTGVPQGIPRIAPQVGYSGANKELGAAKQLSQKAAGSHDLGAPNTGVSLKDLDIPSIGDKVIKTANIELQVKKGRFDSSFEQALAIARGAGGYASQSKSQATGSDTASGEITMCVPAQDFESVLSSLKKLGKVKAIDISGEDVSEEYVDLESRLKNWRAQEAVLLDLMGKAKSVSDSIMIQNNLSQVQMEIERISGRLNFLNNRISYATIRLYIAEPQVVASSDRWGFRTALENALRASATILNALLIMMGYLLPLVVIAAIGYAIYRLVSSRLVARSS